MPSLENILLFLLQVVSFWIIWKFLDALLFKIRKTPEKVILNPPEVVERTESTLLAVGTVAQKPTILSIINQLPKSELLEIPGIGRKTAEKVLANRPFRDKNHLQLATSRRAAKILLEWAKAKVEG